MPRPPHRAYARKVDTLVQGQVERVLNNLNVVKREEFDVVKDMAAKARSENEETGKANRGSRSATRGNVEAR